MNLLAVCISVLGGASAQVQSSAPIVSTKPMSTFELAFTVCAFILTLVIGGIGGYVFARFAMRQGWCAALVIIFFWLGVLFSTFTIIPIIIVFVYKRAKKSAEAAT